MKDFKPAFDFTTDESNILVSKIQIETCINQNIYEGNGEVHLELLPRAGIYFYGDFQEIPMKDALAARLEPLKSVTSLAINNIEVETICLGGEFNESSQKLKLIWRPTSEPINGIGDKNTQISRLVFHLFNFIPFIGMQRSIMETKSIEHVYLTYDEWNIELKSLFSTSENIRTLREKGGYYITHVGGLEKDDSTTFSGNDAYKWLTKLRFFLSFAKGGWSTPVCAVGFDPEGNRVWESWSSPKEPGSASQSWFDPHHSTQLATLFPEYMRKHENDEWYSTLTEVVYWYLNANISSRGIDIGIILTQTAIERLSYEYTVKDKKLLTKNGFEKLWASDKFRILFSSLSVPLEIPCETPEIEKLAKMNNWLDAPHALTEIRNAIIHPAHKKHNQFTSNIYYEAWKLGMWYLEISILAICNYSGTYGNRLKQEWVGQVETVPWD